MLVKHIKQLSEKAKQKDCTILSCCIKSIVNNIWCKGNRTERKMAQLSMSDS